MLKKVQDMLRHPQLGYVFKSYGETWREQPRLMRKEHMRFLRNSLGFLKKPKGIPFETHSHSHFSDGPELSLVVNRLMDVYPSCVWSLTDHGNSEGFDALANGTYDINKTPRGGPKLDVYHEKGDRFLSIRHGYRSNGRILMLRSIEYETKEGVEIGIHGYEGKLPEKMRLKDAIKAGHEAGGFTVINHFGYWKGAGYHTMLDEAVEAGVTAIEVNATEIVPQIYSSVQARLAAKKHNLPLIAGGDAHLVRMYGRSGISFNPFTLCDRKCDCDGDYAKAVQRLVEEHNFDRFFNYVGPILGWKFLQFDKV